MNEEKLVFLETIKESGTTIVNKYYREDDNQEYIVKKIYFTSDTAGQFYQQLKMYSQLQKTLDYYKNIQVNKGVITITVQYIEPATQILNKQYFILQCLGILYKLQNSKIMHRNIQPEHFVVDCNQTVYLIGFNHAVFYQEVEDLYSSYYNQDYDFLIDQQLLGQTLLNKFYPRINYEDILFEKQEVFELEIIRQLYYANRSNIIDIILPINPYEFDNAEGCIQIFTEQETNSILNYFNNQKSASAFFQNNFSIDTTKNIESKGENYLVKNTANIKKQNTDSGFSQWVKDIGDLQSQTSSKQYISYLQFLSDN